MLNPVLWAGLGMMMELVGGAGNWILTPRSRPRLASCCCLFTKCSLKQSGKRVTENNEGFCQNPAIFSILHSLQNPISAPPHGSEQNFNNISRTKLVERTSQWRGTNAQFFSFHFSILLWQCDTHLECFTIQRCYQRCCGFAWQKVWPKCDAWRGRDVLVTQWMVCDLWEVTLVTSQTLWTVPDGEK